MRAAVIHKYGGPGEFRIEQVPEPVIKRHEVLIRAMYSGVNPIDWKQRRGHHRFFLRADFPLIIGYDVSGIIAQTGSNVQRFKKGERVYARCDRRFGKALAEYVATSEETLALIPPKLGYREAAAVPMAAMTALQALRDKAKLQKGDKLLVIGAGGGVGHFALQIGKILGAEVTAVCGSGHDRMMQELQPEHFVNYNRTDPMKLSPSYDVILDAAGIYSYLACRHLLRRKGTYIHTLPRPKILIHKMISLFSRGRVKTLLMKSRGSDLELISTWLSDGRLMVFIDSEYPLEKVADAHGKAEQYHTNGKIVIRI